MARVWHRWREERRSMTMRCIKYLAAVLFLGAGSGHAAERTDLAKIDRQIKKQPKYTAQPLFGLYAFGPEAKTRVWAVLDKSDAKYEQYDVLYFDRNADGDLTEQGERIVGTIDERQRNATFSIGDFTDPNGGDVHTSLVLTRRERSDGSVMLALKWQGHEPMHGGYAETSGPYARFAAAAADAPILWFDASGQFAFQRWGTNELTIGGESDLRVFMGHQGLGKNTFCAVSQDFLPRNVAVAATLIYTDDQGREQRQLNHFRERC
jgi:hypothetical protein